MQSLLRQVKYGVFTVAILLAAIAIFLGLFVLLTLFGLYTEGPRCDTYTTHKLAEWFSSIAEMCKEQDPTWDGNYP